MKKAIFYIRQLIPSTNWSKYKTPDGKSHFAIWSQWLGKVFNHCHYEING